LLLKDDPSAGSRQALEIIFVGGRNRLESKIIPRYNFPFIPISVAGFPRRLTWRWFQVIPKVLLGIVDSFRLLKRLKPKVVIGTGGYVCGPMLLAASLLRIPTLIQEQNAVPGLTNRILGRFVDEIHVAFEEAVKYFKPNFSSKPNFSFKKKSSIIRNTVEKFHHKKIKGKRSSIIRNTEEELKKVRVTGNPIRREIRLLSEAKMKEARWQDGKMARWQPPCPLAPLYAKFGLESGEKTVFVMGGSQGAHPINAAMIEALNFFQNDNPQTPTTPLPPLIRGIKGDEQFTPPLLKAKSPLPPFIKGGNGGIFSKLQIIHQTGQDDYELVKSEYAKRAANIKNLVQPYFENIPEIYALADLMVCRTGAMTIAEITAYGLPAILIPYPHSTGGHQLINAQAMASKGAAIIINDAELTGEILAKNIIDLLENERRLVQMATASKSLGKPNAAEVIAKAVLNLAFRET
jgi:UDP-N-acetylglucosamine--N-acetylmuramyl-(pentapeptide) pyrophosphoryl-undecaprenol N-acetylglucosamine transferase